MSDISVCVCVFACVCNLRITKSLLNIACLFTIINTSSGQRSQQNDRTKKLIYGSSVCVYKVIDKIFIFSKFI